MELLVDKGMTQQEFANLAGVSLVTAQRWVHGKQKPLFAPWEFLVLAQKLGVTPEELAEMMERIYKRKNERLSALAAEASTQYQLGDEHFEEPNDRRDSTGSDREAPRE